MDALCELKDIVRKVVREMTVGVWPYVLVRGADEPEAAA